MDWKPLDKKTLEYIGKEARCCRCDIELDNNTKGYSRSEKDELYCEKCIKKVEKEERSEMFKKIVLTEI